MLALLGAALIGDLIFLPALLASPLGKIFTIRKSPNDKPAPRTEHGDSVAIGSDATTALVPQGGNGEVEYTLADDESKSQEVRPPQMLRRDDPHIRRSNSP